MARTTSPKVATTGASIRAEPGRSTVLCLLIPVQRDQWTKNLLIFAGLRFGLQLIKSGRGDRPLLGRGALWVLCVALIIHRPFI